MADSWEDASDDDWDNAGDDLDLGGLGPSSSPTKAAWDDEEEDEAIKEKKLAEEMAKVNLKKKGTALQQKKEREAAKKLEEEVARKAMEMEAEMEANMTPDERRALEKKRVEDADLEAAEDLFGGVDGPRGGGGGAGGGGQGRAAGAGDTVVLKDLKDHLKHAAKVGAALKKHSNASLSLTFLKELITQSKDCIGEPEISDLIKALNVLKNEKLQAAKRKVKGQAQKSKKDTAKEKKAKKIQLETFGDNDMYDEYDDFGARYEDQFGF